MSFFSPTLKTRNSAAALLPHFARLSIIAGSLFSILLIPIQSAELIPSSRLVDWTPGVAVGIPGGIDQYIIGRTSLIDVTKQPYNADPTGTNDATTAINSAISTAINGQVVYLPPGNYRVSRIATGYKKNITIRGSGSNTILRAHGSETVLYVGGASDYRWDFPGTTVQADLPKGTSTIPMASTTAFSVGNIVSISIKNSTDPNLPVFSTSGFERARSQKTRVIAKTISSITIFPALYFDMPKSLEPKIARTTNVAEFVGIEDLVIDLNNSTAPFGVRMTQSYACWFKNVKITDAPNRHLYITDSVQCEIRQSEFARRRGDGTNGAGLLFQASSGCLIEDNIITSTSSLIQINNAANGNVFAYNFLYDSRLTGVHGPALKTNHGPHNSHNLFEGNIAPNMQCDGYFGGASDDTFIRNWFHGTNPGGLKGSMVSLNRLTRNYTFIGNLIGMPGAVNGAYSFGNPNLGNSNYNGTTQPSKGIWWADLVLTGTISSKIDDSNALVTLSTGASNPTGSLALYWNQDSNSRLNFTVKQISSGAYSISGGSGSPLPTTGTLVRFWRGPGGFQEKDLDVEATTILKGNYLFNGEEAHIPTTESISDPIADSLFRTSKPTWFGNITWPVMNSANQAPSFESIPAGYRYMRGTAPQPSPVVKPSNVRVNISSNIQF